MLRRQRDCGIDTLLRVGLVNCVGRVIRLPRLPGGKNGI